MAPSSMFAASSKPNVAYRDLNLSALLKKQTILSAFVYAGMPYQVLGDRSGAAFVMIWWSRSAIERSGPGISAIFARRARSPSSLLLAALSSWARSFIAARSSAVNLPEDAVGLAGVRVLFFVVFFSAIASYLLVSDASVPRERRTDRRTVQRSSWMRIRFPAGSRKAQSRIP